MTARAILNRGFKRALLAMYAGGVWLFAFGLAGVVIGGKPILILMVGFIGAGSIMLLAFAGAYFLLRCPVCQGRLILLFSGSFRPRLSMGPRIRYCPYCGQDFDAELPAR